MKKLLTVAALTGLVSLSSYGQGTVIFSAGANALTRISYTTPAGTNASIAGPIGSYYFCLFVGPTSLGTGFGTLPGYNDPLAHGFSLVSYGTNSGVVGRFNGNPSTDNTPVPGYITGSSANFVVLGWSANIGGPSYSEFRNWVGGTTFQPDQVWGHSLVAANVQLGGGITPSGSIFGANPGQVAGFNMAPIPEPSTFALMGLGAAALVIFRRRKQ